MITYTLKIKNMDEVLVVFEKAPLAMTREAHNAISKAILLIESKAKREFSSNNKGYSTGRLTQSITSRMTGPAEGIIIANADYSGYVEDGTPAHIIRVKNRRVLANRRAGLFFGKEVNHPGTAANPFMERALDKSQEEIDLLFATAVQNVFT